jgi:hypothetical protein
MKAVNIKPAEPDSYAVVTVALQHKGRVVQHCVALPYPSKVHVIDAATEALRVTCDEMGKIIEGMQRFAEASNPESVVKIAKAL